MCLWENPSSVFLLTLHWIQHCRGSTKEEFIRINHAVESEIECCGVTVAYNTVIRWCLPVKYLDTKILYFYHLLYYYMLIKVLTIKWFLLETIVRGFFCMLWWYHMWQLAPVSPIYTNIVYILWLYFKKKKSFLKPHFIHTNDIIHTQAIYGLVLRKTTGIIT